MKYILTILFFIPALLVFGQDTTFLDNDGYKVASINYATSFKIVVQDQADTNRAIETVYFKSGQMKAQRNYAVYKSRKLDGKVKEWFENGQIRKDIDYKDGKKDGHLFTYWANGKLKRADKYENDKLIEGKCMTSEGREMSHYDFERRPEFPGGINGLRQYLSKEIKYPKNSTRAGIEGRVLVGFVVNKNGSISEIKIIESVYKELDEEAMRVVKKMPNWEPGTEDGEAIRVAFHLPIQFKLQ